jgi:hypothetical protein
VVANGQLTGDDVIVAGRSDPRPDQHGDPEEIVEFGAARRPFGGRLPRLLLTALVAATLVFVLYRPGTHQPNHSAKRTLSPPPVSIARVGHRILGISATWDLFGLTSNGLVSIQFGRAQITRTVLPPTPGDASVSLVLGPRQAYIRPLDNAPGYVVPDGLPGRSLTGILSRGGLLLPGPAPGEEWYISNSEQITLVGPAGTASGPPFAAVAAQYPGQSAMADGRGYVVLFNSSGVEYDATPTGLRPVGALLVAVGPKNWLGLGCQQGQCRNVVVNAKTGVRRTLPGAALNVVSWPWPAEPGVASPDGSLAVVIVTRGALGMALDLVNLSTGRTTTLPVPVGMSSDSRALAWSPDSRWLFVLTGTGRLVAVRVSDGTVHSLGVGLPALSQIAMRGTSS